MLITNEYTTLVKDGEVIRILPNKEFDTIPKGYTVTAFARVYDMNTKETILLNPGQFTSLHPPSNIEEKPKRKGIKNAV
jgi:hypothetical protein